jgi:hypothetical protein
MIGIGIPRSHNNSPRPMTSSCFTSFRSAEITKSVPIGSAPCFTAGVRFHLWALTESGWQTTATRLSCCAAAYDAPGCNGEPRRYIAFPIFHAGFHAGGMAEWLKAHAWKACIRETVSWVRIPLPPPSLLRNPFSGDSQRRLEAPTLACWALNLWTPRSLRQARTFFLRLFFSRPLYFCSEVRFCGAR